MAQSRKKKKRTRSRHDPERAARAAQREEARARMAEERRQAQALAERRKNWLTRARGVAGPVLGGLAVFFIALTLLAPPPELESVERVGEAQDIGTVEPGSSIVYDGPAPTSGSYYTGDPACGVFTEMVAPEDAMTAQAFGAVIVWYRPDAGDAVVDQIEAIAAEFDSLLVVSPNDGIAEEVVATSWNRRRVYTSGDGVNLADSLADPELGLAKFISTYQDRGDTSGECPL